MGNIPLKSIKYLNYIFVCTLNSVFTVHGPQLRDGPAQPGQRRPVPVGADPGHDLPPLPEVLRGGPAEMRAPTWSPSSPSWWRA